MMATLQVAVPPEIDCRLTERRGSVKELLHCNERSMYATAALAPNVNLQLWHPLFRGGSVTELSYEPPSFKCYELVLQGHEYRFGSVIGVQLGQDVGDVKFHRGHGDGESGRNILV